MSAWCVVRGIDYQIDECPLAAGNRHLEHKAVLNELEARSRGAKAAFYLTFLDNMAPVLAPLRREITEALTICTRCGAPTPGSDSPASDGLCAFCRLVERASAHEPVPVEMLVKRR